MENGAASSTGEVAEEAVLVRGARPECAVLEAEAVKFGMGRDPAAAAIRKGEAAQGRAGALPGLGESVTNK